MQQHDRGSLAFGRAAFEVVQRQAADVCPAAAQTEVVGIQRCGLGWDDAVEAEARWIATRVATGRSSTREGS
jgi:hypothetical protein